MARSSKPAGESSGTPKPARSTRKGNGSTHAPRDADAVARRAYEIYQSRGGSHGADLDDWLEAERQLQRALSDVSGPAAAKPRKRKASAGTEL